jgi:mono/diheme cytochrome c family protein
MKKNLSAITITVLSMLFLLIQVGSAVPQDPPPKTPELTAKGKPLFEQNCAPCHGNQGNGKGHMAAMLNPPPADLTAPIREWKNSKGHPEKIFGIIKKGLPNSSMIAFALPDEDLWALVYTVMEFGDRKIGAEAK